MTPFGLTADRHEMQWGTNHMGKSTCPGSLRCILFCHQSALRLPTFRPIPADGAAGPDDYCLEGSHCQHVQQR
jgi:hypothetical protein